MDEDEWACYGEEHDEARAKHEPTERAAAFGRCLLWHPNIFDQLPESRLGETPAAPGRPGGAQTTPG